MLIDSNNKRMRVGKLSDQDLFNMNMIYFDFETGIDINDENYQYLRPYFNDIIHYYNKEIKNRLTISSIDGITNKCKDVTKETLNYILQVM